MELANISYALARISAEPGDFVGLTKAAESKRRGGREGLVKVLLSNQSKIPSFSPFSEGNGLVIPMN